MTPLVGDRGVRRIVMVSLNSRIKSSMISTILHCGGPPPDPAGRLMMEGEGAR